MPNQFAVGDTDDPPAGGGQRSVTEPVLLERLARVVEGAVDLDHEAFLGPGSVDLEPSAGERDAVAVRRLRQTAASDEVQEQVLPLAWRDGRGCRVILDHGSDDRRSGGARVAGYELRQGQPVVMTLHLDVLDGAPEQALRENAGEIEEGAGRAGQGEAVADDHFVWREERAVVPDARERPALSSDRDVDQGADPGADLELRGSGVAADDGAIATGENGAVQERCPIVTTVTDGVDAARHSMETAGLQSVLDRSPAQAEVAQLGEVNEAALEAPGLGDGLIRRSVVTQPMYLRVFVTTDRHQATVAARASRVVRWM